MAIEPGKCSEPASGGATFSSGKINAKGIMLFGVRLTETGGSSFRKSASMNNLVQFDEQTNESNVDAAGYASDDVVHPSARSRERKRGINVLFTDRFILYLILYSLRSRLFYDSI